MAVSLITTIQRWKGLSTDNKPTSAPEGSTFEETDTGQKFVWLHGGWIEDFSGALSTSKALDIGDTQKGLLEQILVETIAQNRANGIVP